MGRTAGIARSRRRARRRARRDFEGGTSHRTGPRPRGEAATGPAPWRRRLLGVARRLGLSEDFESTAAHDLMKLRDAHRRSIDRMPPNNVRLGCCSSRAGHFTWRPGARVARRGEGPRDAAPQQRRCGGIRSGGAPPRAEPRAEHRYARRAVRSPHPSHSFSRPPAVSRAESDPSVSRHPRLPD